MAGLRRFSILRSVILGGFILSSAEASQACDENASQTDQQLHRCNRIESFEVAWSVAPRVHEVIGTLRVVNMLDLGSFSASETMHRCPESENHLRPSESVSVSGLSFSCYISSAMEGLTTEQLWSSLVAVPELNASQHPKHPFGTLTAKRLMEPAVGLKSHGRIELLSYRTKELSANFVAVHTSQLPLSDGSFWPFVITWPNATIEAAESATKNVSGALQNAEYGGISHIEPSPTPKSEVLWHIIRMTADAVQVIYHGLAYIASGTWRCLRLLSASAIEAAVTSVQALLGAASWCFRWLSDVLETVQKTHLQWPYFVTGAVIAIVSILAVCTMVILSQVRTFMTAEILALVKEKEAEIKRLQQDLSRSNTASDGRGLPELKNELTRMERENASLTQRGTDLFFQNVSLQGQVEALQSRLGTLLANQTEIKDLEKQLLQEKSEKESLAKLLDSQPSVDGETWQFHGDSGEWVSFPEAANKLLLSKFKDGYEICNIVIDGKSYCVDFKKSSQKNLRTGKERYIRYSSGLPVHWQMSDADAARLLDCGTNFWQVFHEVKDSNLFVKLMQVLNASIRRHDGTRCMCFHGNSTFEVVQAYQIKNPHLWRRYQRFARSIRDKHKQQGICPERISPPVSNALTEFAREIDVDLNGNERLLLHGTKNFEVAQTIATEGFDNRVAKDAVCLYGAGSYFAAQTCKSAQYAMRDGMKKKASIEVPGTILLARVAIGDPFYTPSFCKKESRPPMKNGVRADSIIARPGIPNGQPAGIQSHLEVVTFDPAQSYPEFIVRFVEH